MYKTLRCRVLLLLSAVWRDLHSGELNIRAMGLVYSTLLSLVPMLALSFSILKGFGVHYKIEPMLLKLLEPLGDKSVEVTTSIIGFVNNVKIGVLGTTGLILLIYTVISLMNKVESSVNFTWRITDTRKFTDQFARYFSLLLIAPVLMFTALGLGSSVSDIGMIRFLTENYGSVIAFLSSQAPKILIILAFMMVYLLIPNTRVKLLPALGGAVVAGLLWQLGSWGFTSFVSNATTQTAIYSAFASLMFFMIWLYLSWMFLLLGATTAYYLQNPRATLLSRAQVVASPKLKLAIALAITRLIYSRASDRKSPPTSVELASALDVPDDYIEQVLQLLIDHQILMKNDRIPPSYLPYLPADQLDFSTLLKMVMQGNKQQMQVAVSIQQVNRALPDVDKWLDEIPGRGHLDNSNQ